MTVSRSKAFAGIEASPFFQASLRPVTWLCNYSPIAYCRPQQRQNAVHRLSSQPCNEALKRECAKPWLTIRATLRQTPCGVILASQNFRLDLVLQERESTPLMSCRKKISKADIDYRRRLPRNWLICWRVTSNVRQEGIFSHVFF